MDCIGTDAETAGRIYEKKCVLFDLKKNKNTYKQNEKMQKNI